MILRNILQHFPKSDHSELIRIINSFNEVEQSDIIKDIGFVTPNIVANIVQIAAHFPTVKLKIDGGYEQAIKKKIILYPNYYEDIESEIILFEIKYPRKFQKLEHKHILGTLLNNGIRENLIGDIVIEHINPRPLIWLLFLSWVPRIRLKSPCSIPTFNKDGIHVYCASPRINC